VAQRKKKGRGRALGLAAFALLAALATEALAQAIKALPQMTAKSVFVMNADTGQVLYEKNPDQVFRILSLTKLVTAYVLFDQMGDRLSKSVTISGSHLTGGSSAGPGNAPRSAGGRSGPGSGGWGW